MRLPFSKDNRKDIAGVMFAHVIGFIDGVQWPGSNIAEVYILGHWLQVLCVISAGGGATNRVLKILESYSEQVLPSATSWLLQSKRLQQNDIPAFQSYVNAHAQQRRHQYDTAFRTRGSMRDVAEIAIPNLISSRDNTEVVTADVDLLENCLLGVGTVAIPKLKEMF